MLYPNIFRNDFFDDFMDWPSRSTNDAALMKSDVKDAGDHYELMMDLPGFRKEDVKIQLKDGVLSFEATTASQSEDKDEKGKYLRQERFQGTCTRSFYVGEDLTEEDIRARFENGVLTVSVPKEENRRKVEQNHFISIEG